MRNYCQSVIGWFDGLGLDHADIAQEDYLDIGVCYQGMPGCRKRDGFIPLEQISLEDMDPLWREMIESNTSAGFEDLAMDLVNETASESINSWELTENSTNADSDWHLSEADLLQLELDRQHEEQIKRFLEKACGIQADEERSRKRVGHPLQENRRQTPPIRQLLIQKDPPLL